MSGFHSDSCAARQELSTFGLMPSQKGHKEEQNPNFMKSPFTLCSILTVVKLWDFGWINNGNATNVRPVWPPDWGNTPLHSLKDKGQERG